MLIRHSQSCTRSWNQWLRRHLIRTTIDVLLVDSNHHRLRIFVTRAPILQQLQQEIPLSWPARSSLTIPPWGKSEALSKETLRMSLTRAPLQQQVLTLASHRCNSSSFLMVSVEQEHDQLSRANIMH